MTVVLDKHTCVVFNAPMQTTTTEDHGQRARIALVMRATIRENGRTVASFEYVVRDYFLATCNVRRTWY